MGTSTMSEQRQIMETWADLVWRRRDVRAIDALFEDDGVAGGLGRDDLAGPSEFRQFHAAICELLSDTWLDIGEHLEQGNKIACLCSFGGNCKKTGEAIEMKGSMFFEFRGNKILHCANHFEFMDFFEQLGLLPDNSFAKALGGVEMA